MEDIKALSLDEVPQKSDKKFMVFGDGLETGIFHGTDRCHILTI
jgi:hypothetical protein